MRRRPLLILEASVGGNTLSLPLERFHFRKDAISSSMIAKFGL